MEALGNLHITFDIKPVVKLTCLNLSCKNNMMDIRAGRGKPYCNLKHVRLDPDGKCTDFSLTEGAGDEENI
jgi:hypothetical protein